MPDAPTTSAHEPCLAATHRGALSLFLSVLLTYPRRPLLWIWPVGTAVLATIVPARLPPMTVSVVPPTPLSQATSLPFDNVFVSTFILACVAGFLAASVTGHFVALLRPPRGQIVPRLRVTALAANILLTVSFVLVAALLWPHPRISFQNGGDHATDIPVHALALVTVLAAQLAWTQFAPITGFASFFSWGLLAYPRARDAVLRMIIGEAPVLECGAMILGVGLFVGLWVVILRRRDRPFELDPILEALRHKFFGDDDDAAPTPAPSAFPGTIPALAAPRTFTAASRRRLHRRALAGGNRPVFAGLVVGLSLVTLVYVLRFFGLEHMDAVTPRVLIYMVSIVPAALVSASAMENRGPLITHGLLLPQHRRQFVRDVGLAMLANLFTLWIAAILPILLLVALDVPDHVRPSPAAFTGILAIAAAYQLFALGVIAWLLRLNHRIIITIVQTAGCALGIPIVSLNPGPSLLPVALAITIAFTLTGLAFALTAHRRWATTEPPSAGPSKTAAAL